MSGWIVAWVKETFTRNKGRTDYSCPYCRPRRTRQSTSQEGRRAMMRTSDEFQAAQALTGCGCDDDMTASGHSQGCKWFVPMEALLTAQQPCECTTLRAQLEEARNILASHNCHPSCDGIPERVIAALAGKDGG